MQNFLDDAGWRLNGERPVGTEHFRPGEADRNLSMEDYRRNGIEHVTRAIEEIVPNRTIHAAGYWLGGTLLATEAALRYYCSDVGAVLTGKESAPSPVEPQRRRRANE
jgi:hypothetical protein